MNPLTYKFNLKKDKPDSRDLLFKAEKLGVDRVQLPTQYDLRVTGAVPPVLDQGSIGSCGPNQISNSLRYCLKKLKLSPDFQPSRLYIYFFARVIDGSDTNQDTGISIRNGLKSVSKHGVCSENNWGYNIKKFREKPSNEAIKAAGHHIDGYKYISIPQDLDQLKRALVGGFPIICGIQLYSSFTSAGKTGIVPIPNKQKESQLGGHCVCIVGYNDKLRLFTLMNSWGDWGNDGYFCLSYDYILDKTLSSDFWIVTFFK